VWRVTKAKRIDETEWEAEFERWLDPFLSTFGHEAHQKWAPVYLRGLLAPGERKSVEPMAARVCPGETQQLHHFVATSRWAIEGLEQVLLQKAQELVGGKDAHLIIDDTALVKKGLHSVGVAHQYCGQLGKSANCQALVSLTLACGEVPVPVALRLYLPKEWATNPARRLEAKVPDTVVFRPKWRIALDEIEGVVRAGVKFGDVLADAGYGGCAAFRQGLSALGLTWAVGVPATCRVYPRSVRVTVPAPTCATGRPPTLARVSAEPQSAKQIIASLGRKAFRSVQWRRGTKGMLQASFAAVRVRACDGPKVLGHRHGPGEEVWLVCERRSGGETKYYMTNHPKEATLETLAAAIKARWVCEQAHQQMKEELGLDHFEGRSWIGLHHHTLLTMIAFAFLQHLRQLENKAQAQRAAA
jgi:SRSO17 transposase